MWQVQLTNLGANLSVAVAGFVCVWAILRFWDRTVRPDPDSNRRLSFSRDVWPEIKAGNWAMGAYYGRRILGALIFVGLVFSRVAL